MTLVVQMGCPSSRFGGVPNRVTKPRNGRCFLRPPPPRSGTRRLAGQPGARARWPAPRERAIAPPTCARAAPSRNTLQPGRRTMRPTRVAAADASLHRGRPPPSRRGGSGAARIMMAKGRAPAPAEASRGAATPLAARAAAGAPQPIGPRSARAPGQPRRPAAQRRQPKQRRAAPTTPAATGNGRVEQR